MKKLFDQIVPEQRLEVDRQRADYGVARIDSVDLDTHVATILVNGLEMLQSNLDGSPPHLTQDEWKAILEEMHDCFLSYLEADLCWETHNGGNDAYTEYNGKINKVYRGFELLSKYFIYLWS